MFISKSYLKILMVCEKIKKQATYFIDEQYAKGKSPEHILFKAELLFGISKKMVNDRIALIEKITGVDKNGSD